MVMLSQPAPETCCWHQLKPSPVAQWWWGSYGCLPAGKARARAVDSDTWADKCYLTVCCCSDRQGATQAVRAGHRWGQWPLHGSTQGCCVSMDSWVLLSFSCLFPHETGARAGTEMEDGREGCQVKYLFIKCFVISQLDATAGVVPKQVVDRLDRGAGVCSQISSSSSPLFTSHLSGVWASGRQ